MKQQILPVRLWFEKLGLLALTNVAPVCPTLGDGNCLYRAIVESLSVSQSPYWGNYGDLRNEIVSYVDHNRHLDFVATFSDTLNIVEDGEDIVSLDTVIRRQYCNGEYGLELFILAAAQKLDNYIYLFSFEQKKNLFEEKVFCIVSDC